MKNKIVLVAVIALAAFYGCRRHKMDGMEKMEKNIFYPAAFVVNGEDATLSVIRLSDQKVTETILLMGANMEGDAKMWPHHIYLKTDDQGHHLAIAMPGMDLSAGHLGSTPGMKGRVMVLDGVNATVQKDMEVPDMNHNAVFSPNGKEIWTSQMNSGNVLVLDAATQQIKQSIAVGNQPAEVTFSADGSKAYVANGGSDNVSIIDPVTKNILQTVSVGHNPVAAWVGYDGNMYVDNEEGESVSIIDVATNVVTNTIALHFMPGSVAHHRQAGELWVTAPQEGKTYYWSWSAQQNSWIPAGSFATGNGAHAIAFSSDGATAFITNQMAHTVSVIDVASHSKTKDIAVGKKPNGIVLKY